MSQIHCTDLAFDVIGIDSGSGRLCLDQYATKLPFAALSTDALAQLRSLLTPTADNVSSQVDINDIGSPIEETPYARYPVEEDYCLFGFSCTRLSGDKTDCICRIRVNGVLLYQQQTTDQTVIFVLPAAERVPVGTDLRFSIEHLATSHTVWLYTVFGARIPLV